MATVTFPYTLTAGQPENVNNLNSNLGALLTGVNNVESAQIVDGTIVAGDLASSVLDTLSPVGSLVDWAGAGDPTPVSGSIKWLLADGRAVSRTTYSLLFTNLSTTYGVGDGSTTFNLPDLRGRVSAGPDTMGTAQGAASRLASNNTRGAVGGAETFSIASANIPQITADITTPTLTFTGTAGTTGNDADPTGGAGVRQWVVADGVSAFTYGPNTGLYGSPQLAIYKTHTHSFTPAGTISGSGHTHTLGNVSPTAVNKTPPYQVINKIIRVA